jgi:DNA-binding NarL/FixJ family response regulator
LAESLVSWDNNELAIMITAKIFVVSAQDIFRAGLIAIACNEPTLQVVGDATTLTKATRSIVGTAPDLIILDLHGCDSTQELWQVFRDHIEFASKVLVITSNSTEHELTQCIQNGVNGIVCRNVASSEMMIAIKKVLAGRPHYCTYTNSKLRKDDRSCSLTKRELEVLQFLALGLSNKEIADRLGVGIGTVKTHLININSKLHVTTRTEAVIRGVQQRWIRI